MKRTIPLLLMLAMAAQHVAAQDTIRLVYNEASQRLTISQKAADGHHPCLRLGAGEQAERLARVFQDGAKLPTSDNPQFVIMSVEPPKEVARASWFDSAQCAALDIRAYDGRQWNATNIGSAPRYRVQVEVVRPAVAEVVAEPASSGKAGGSSWLLPMLIGVVVVCAGAGAVVLLRRKGSKAAPKKENAAQGTSDMMVVEEVSSGLATGLDHVRQAGDAYYMMDMQQDFADTAVHKIYLHHTAVKKMYDFFKQALESSDQTNETGCYFIGCWEYADGGHKSYNISLEDIVEPGDDIVPGEFSFNFGLKIGVKLYSKISALSQQTGRDIVQTVWMHSHPGLGLFLSSHDLTVQQQLTYSDAPNRLVAFVIDTNTPDWEFAVFTAKASGAMNNKDDLRRTYQLEALYKWSRSAHVGNGGAGNQSVNAPVEAPLSPDKYHAVQVNHQGSHRTLNVYFSGKAINAIDDALYESAGRQQVAGYLVGECRNGGDIVVEDCLGESAEKMIGLLVVDAEVDDERIEQQYVQQGEGVEFLIVCRKDDELLLITRQDGEGQPFSIEQAAVCPMSPMKEWLRRRRVYK